MAVIVGSLPMRLKSIAMINANLATCLTNRGGKTKRGKPTPDVAKPSSTFMIMDISAEAGWSPNRRSDRRTGVRVG
jgi:hypothetical protein